jgi:hypothetical protein
MLTGSRSWWDSHEQLLWSVSTRIEQCQWIVGVLLLVYFSAVS